MTRHITDRTPVPVETKRVERALGIARKGGEAGPHPAVQALFRRDTAVKADSAFHAYRPDLDS